MQTEKELQSGGEVKELADTADKLSKRLVKDTTAWTNKKENLEADQAACQQACLRARPYAAHTCLQCTGSCRYLQDSTTAASQLRQPASRYHHAQLVQQARPMRHPGEP